ncbi:metallophosphoesterase [Bacteroides sp.]|uniref:metallophosphoesterase n=1 Tax=Bacteroides sp. TaxID=29523 RepID=UPI0025C037AD|nr:metallophosphoesterase [Bacteroides sp.]
MKKIYSIYLLLGLFIATLYSCREDLTPVGPDIAEITHFRHDGPYLFYENGKLKILEVAKDNTLSIREESGLPAGLKLDVYSDDNQLLFQVPINKIDNFERPAWDDRASYEKTFAVSDLHGRFDLFAAILKAGEVINDNYEWTYGNNHLVINGDIFDRGADVLPILWLIYKLEFEAKAAGGMVTTILGDHEELVMRDNLKYTYAKYNTLSQRAMNMTYGKMWGLTNVMGNWLRSKNTIQIVGENLYVHAGLSKAFMEREETIPEINELVAKSIYLTKEERKKQFPNIADFLYSDSYNGPLWYRGMVKTGSDYSPIKDADVQTLLDEYNVERIIVGHTENSRVKYTYSGKVYDICVNHPKAFEKETRAVLIKDGEIKAVNDKGELVTIKK